MIVEAWPNSKTLTLCIVRRFCAHDPMKKPFLAFLLSFILPGAGLAYLGLSRPALINFAIVLGLGVVLACILPPDVFDHYTRYLCYGASGGSAAYAQLLAKQRNAKLRSTDES